MVGWRDIYTSLYFVDFAPFLVPKVVGAIHGNGGGGGPATSGSEAPAAPAAPPTTTSVMMHPPPERAFSFAERWLNTNDKQAAASKSVSKTLTSGKILQLSSNPPTTLAVQPPRRRVVSNPIWGPRAMVARW